MIMNQVYSANSKHMLLNVATRLYIRCLFMYDSSEAKVDYDVDLMLVLLA